MSKRGGPENDPVLGNSPYPSKKELNRIKNWPYTDLLGLFKYIEERWMYPEYWDIRDDLSDKIVLVTCSTGGWSGNEDLIGALQQNTMAWALTWQESRRGGHYKFEMSNMGGKENS